MIIFLEQTHESRIETYVSKNMKKNTALHLVYGKLNTKSEKLWYHK